MDIKITYPTPPKQRMRREAFLAVARWPMIAAAIVCPVINFFIGGKAWSVIVLMGLYMVWTLALSTDLVEYNRISQCIKYTFQICIMLVLIDMCLVSGWATFVVPIVAFTGLSLAVILFLTDISRQKQNLFPILTFIVLSFVGAAVAAHFYEGYIRMIFAITSAMALVWLIVCICVLGNDFLRELKRRFHIK